MKRNKVNVKKRLQGYKGKGKGKGQQNTKEMNTKQIKKIQRK